jgi:hypothetical protein
MTKRLIAVAVATVALAAAPAASADVPTDPSCFGAGAAELGQAGAMGEHSSSFDEPRLGIGNVAFLLTGTHQPGELAALLGATCP